MDAKSQCEIPLTELSFSISEASNQILRYIHNTFFKQEAQLMLTTGSTRLIAVSRARAMSDGTLT